MEPVTLGDWLATQHAAGARMFLCETLPVENGLVKILLLGLDQGPQANSAWDVHGNQAASAMLLEADLDKIWGR